MLPIEALTTLGSNISTPGLIMAISFIPKPRQERMIVPKLPMSDGFTKTTWSLLASKYEEYFLNTPTTKVLPFVDNLLIILSFRQTSAFPLF